MGTSDKTEAVLQATDESSQHSGTWREGHRPELSVPQEKKDESDMGAEDWAGAKGNFESG